MKHHFNHIDYIGIWIVVCALGGFLYGKQAPQPLFITSDRCMACHNGLTDDAGKDVSIGANWRGSMMAHSALDPYWQAGVRREIMEHPEAKEAIEDKCSSCHMPMARFMAKAGQQKGQVFAHLPFTRMMGANAPLAFDGVSCTMCHQISAEKLGTKESFTAGFVVDTVKPLGARTVYGPFEIDPGRQRVMRSSALLEPAESKHIQDSSFCASCHTLYTHSLGADGEVVGELPEQVPYLEWYHSSYKDIRSCQSCHMPELKNPTPVTSVLGIAREAFSRHVFRGGNFFMPKIFNLNRVELSVQALPNDLDRMAEETAQHLKDKAAGLTIESAKLGDGEIQLDVRVRNLTGHKLPTAYPSRRVWLALDVTDEKGRTVFSSGKLNKDGSIAGNDNDANAAKYEPHYDLITRSDQVQIYESVMADYENKVTTSLLAGLRFVKDNRVLPRGFDKKTADDDIAVQGAAARDSNFDGFGDIVKYAIKADNAAGPYRVSATLYYQPIGFRWARNLNEFKAMETERFVKYYDELAHLSAIALAQEAVVVE